MLSDLLSHLWGEALEKRFPWIVSLRLRAEIGLALVAVVVGAGSAEGWAETFFTLAGVAVWVAICLRKLRRHQRDEHSISLPANPIFGSSRNASPEPAPPIERVPVVDRQVEIEHQPQTHKPARSWPAPAPQPLPSDEHGSPSDLQEVLQTLLQESGSPSAAGVDQAHNLKSIGTKSMRRPKRRTPLSKYSRTRKAAAATRPARSKR
jgi:hypothetical protein